ncbi:hypothetical protein PCASD_26237 [Puccinia coronata f. sp. avenae]|uniref:Uncharacterized protein n=1 Tax=Puccinia coronata f. sp. avenae TaxID=200324 RepID=A0A2N5S7N1_9BASI|nr:hypothetical protein PCASD_26237 [Puccinia coronata f. sp. avenae]
MLASLPLNNTIKEIFANIKATSDTELTPPRALVRIPLLWRSAEITMFAQCVDNEARRIPSTASHHTGFKDVPCNLPRNCYNASYLSELLETQLVLLNPTNPIPMADLLQGT